MRHGVSEPGVLDEKWDSAPERDTIPRAADGGEWCYSAPLQERPFPGGNSMVIGVPREFHRDEHRVGLTPFAVARLLKNGHTVFVESHAGDAAHFSDQDYQNAGGQIVYSPEEAYQRSDIVCRIGTLPAEAVELVRPGSLICAFHHLAVAPKEIVRTLMDAGTTLVGYEMIHDAHDDLPVLVPFSEMGGQMAVYLASFYLQTETGGRGVLLGAVPGVPPPTVLILGAGTVGYSAARRALACGAHAIVLDEDRRKLSALNREFGGQVVTVVASMQRLERYTAIADVVIGAVLIPGARAPFLVTESMVKAMRPGSVIVDVSIDQGGCVETSRPTTLQDPIFVKHDVLHYCVPNMTANVPRTASRVLANAALPYILDLANKGPEQALREDPGLAESVYVYRGKMVNDGAGAALGIPAESLQELLQEG
jgi:alanine dehydrogenase